MRAWREYRRVLFRHDRFFVLFEEATFALNGLDRVGVALHNTSYLAPTLFFSKIPKMDVYLIASRWYVENYDV